MPMSLRIVLVISSLKQKKFLRDQTLLFLLHKTQLAINHNLFIVSYAFFLSEILYNFIYWTKVADILEKNVLNMPVYWSLRNLSTCGYLHIS